MATYYIDPSGNDTTGTGSIGSPWKTLYKATTAIAVSGNIIHINAGTYIETQQIVLAPGVSLEGDGRTTTIIKSTLTSDFNEMINCRSAMGTNGNQHITGLQFDGQNSTWALIRIGGRSNFEIYNCDFINAKIHGVTFAAWNIDYNDNGYPNYPATQMYCTGNKFYNNTMTNCGGWEIPNTGGNGFGNLQFGGQNGFLVYDNTIIQNRAPYNNGWPIKYWQGGYNVDCKIYNNYLQHRLQDFTLGDQNWDFAIEMFNCTGMEIYGNTIINGCVDYNYTSTTGFGMGGTNPVVGPYTYSLWIHDNVFYCSSVNTHIQTGITLEFNVDTVIVENNTFDKYNIGVLFTPRTNCNINNVKIQKNLFTNVSIGDGTEGYFIDCGVYSGSNINFNNLEIYNNTFLANSSSPVEKGIMLPNSTGTGVLQNIKIKNNILKGVAGAPLQVREGTVAITNLDIQYNDLYGNGNSNLPTYTVTPGSGYTFSNNVNVNPSFGTGYELVTGSSLIDAGIDVGLAYTGSAPNINWTEATVAAPPVVCNSFDINNIGPGSTLSNSNRTINKTGFADNTSFVTAGINSGKVYWKVLIDSIDTINDPYNFMIGMAPVSHLSSTPPYGTDSYVVRSDGQLFNNGFYPNYSTGGSWTSGFTTGDEIVFALDMNSGGRLDMYKKISGVWTQKSNYFNGITAATYFAVVGTSGRPFQYTIDLSPTDIPSGLVSAGYGAYCSGIPPNVAPTANAGTDQTITLPTTTVSLTGSGSDSDGTISSYLWSKVSGPAGSSITTPNSQNTTVTGLTTGTYIFQLIVTDNNGATGSDTVQVTVTSTNTSPIANAGSDSVVYLPTSSVALIGSGTDSDGSISSYLWTKLTGPSCTISNPNIASTTATGLTAGTYIFQLTVTDNLGATGSDTKQVIVNNQNIRIKRKIVKI